MCIRDRPIPGSPPSNVTDPGIKPPPNTLSNSKLFVASLYSFDKEILFIEIGFFGVDIKFSDNVFQLLLLWTSIISSSIVFHSLQT